MNARGTFRFGGRDVGYAENEGERAVEIPIAREFLARHGARPDFVEVGAVSPYWWHAPAGGLADWWTPAPVARVPHRVIDPHDPYPLAERVGIMDADLRGCAVLCVSTIEHVGMGDYGDRPIDPESAGRALDRLVRDAEVYLVTWPTGHNRALDRHARALVEAPGSTVTGFQFEQHAPHEYRLRAGFDWSLPYGAPSDPLPYGRGVVFLTNDGTLLAFAKDFAECV